MTEEAQEAYRHGNVDVLRQSRHWIGMMLTDLVCWSYKDKYYVTESVGGTPNRFLGTYDTAEDAMARYYRRENFLVTD